jgi:hypothetical protein
MFCKCRCRAKCYLFTLEFRASDYIDLSGAILNGVDFHQTNLIDANLNGITLTDARLWETQRTDGPCKGSPARLPIGTEIGKKGRLSWIPGASLVKRGVTGCFYRLSHEVMAEEASFGKVVSYRELKAFTGCIRPPESHMSHL